MQLKQNIPQRHYVCILVLNNLITVSLSQNIKIEPRSPGGVNLFVGEYFIFSTSLKISAIYNFFSVIKGGI